MNWTLVVDVDLSFGIIRKDAPIVLRRLFPVAGRQLRIARSALEEKLLGKHVDLCTRGIAGSDGAYGAVVYLNNENINEWIIDSGLGKRIVTRNSF
jgi:hypothetical protein